jgi:hypothetical protein
LDWLLDADRVDGVIATESLECDDIPGLEILDRIIAPLISNSGSSGIVPQYSGAIIGLSNLDFVSVGGNLNYFRSHFAWLQSRVWPRQTLASSRFMQCWSCHASEQQA